MLRNSFAADRLKLATCRKLTAARRDKIKSRLRAAGWFDDFREAVQSLPLGGDGWQPTLDWLVRNDHNIYLLLEGSFDWRTRGDPAAERLAKQKRKNAYDERQREEQWKKQQRDNDAGRKNAISDICNQATGNADDSDEASLLFG